LFPDNHSTAEAGRQSCVTPDDWPVPGRGPPPDSEHSVHGGPSPRRRSRAGIALALAGVVAAGLLSRTPAFRSPWAAKEIGDTLWAVMFYLWAIFLAPGLRPSRAAAAAVGVTFAIEFLKLYHPSWLDAVRANRVAGFLLGHTFFWHDLACYLLGVAIAAAGDVALARRQRATRNS
jgi:hypothetical protein